MSLESLEAAERPATRQEIVRGHLLAAAAAAASAIEELATIAADAGALQLLIAKADGYRKGDLVPLEAIDNLVAALRNAIRAAGDPEGLHRILIDLERWEGGDDD